uniref:Cytochrome b5 heme-binding domain-containing protein n=1 Tax=Pectinophora gossypiella TaxID=13191 RepID=A0A1E1WVG0_PECGO
MGLISFVSRNIKLILTIIVVVVSIIYKNELQLLYKSWNTVEVSIKTKNKSVFTEQELSVYNGVDKKKLYLSLLGNIYDVTKGKRHYGKDGSYNYFIGKDGTRAFVTGNFRDESKNKDHVIDLSCDDLLSLLHWKDTLKEKYKPVVVE